MIVEVLEADSYRQALKLLNRKEQALMTDRPGQNETGLFLSKSLSLECDPKNR